MKSLYKKLVRDVKASKWQFAAVVLLVVIGQIFFVGLYSSFQNLWNSIDGPYTNLNFADFTVKVYRAPSSVVGGIRGIEGVKAVEGRINQEIPMRMPGMENQVLTARVITLPQDTRPMVNDVQVTEGAYFSSASNSNNETLVEKFFSEYHGLKAGDKLHLIVGSNQTEFVVRGIVISPEYLWPAKNLKDHMPTVLRSWGVLFLPENRARGLLNIDDEINEVAVTTVTPSVREDAIDRVKAVLEPYGIAEVVKRENQASEKNLQLMLGSLDVLAPVLSGFFLLVAGMSTYVLLTRMVNAQSTQIGTMRALGHGRRPILLYYLSFALIVWLTSSVLGIFFGHIASIYLTNLFASRISLPIILIEFQWTTQALGILLVLIFLTCAAALPAWSAASLKPAVAMRPRAPRIGRVFKMDSALFFLRRKSSGLKMSFRNLPRSKRRSVSTILGVVLATSLVVSTSSFLDSFDYWFKVAYEDIAVYDLKVTFIRSQQSEVIAAAKNITGVVVVEPFIEIPYHIRHHGQEFSALIMGLNANATLYRLYTDSGEPTRVDAEGILLAELLKDKLKTEVNDSLELHVFNSTRTVRVAGFVNSPFGDAAFLSIEKAQEVTGFGDAVNVILVKADAQAQETVRQELFTLPAVSSVDSVSQQKEDNMEMLKVFNAFVWAIFTFGVLMAFAVVFNTVSLNILERSQELATMRTIGMTMRKIAGLVSLENILLGSVGIAVGLPMGNYLAKYFFSFFTSDLFVIEAVTYASTYVLAASVIAFVLLVSSAPGLRYVKRLNLAKVVKEQSR